MWRAKVLLGLEQTHIPGRENSKSQGVAMTSDWGKGGSSGVRGRDRDAIRAQLYLHFIPEATSGSARKELREIADRNNRCSNALRVPPSARTRDDIRKTRVLVSSRFT